MIDMKRRNIISCYCRMTLGLFAFSLCLICHAQGKSACTNHVFVFQSLVKSPEMKIVENIITEAYRRAGCRVRFVRKSELVRGEIFDLISKGVYDGELARIDGLDEDCPELIKVYSPVSWVEPVVLSKKRILTKYGWCGIGTHRVGVLEDSMFSSVVTANSKKVPAKSFDGLVEMLIADRIDIAILPSLTANIYLKKYKEAKISILVPQPEKILLYHYLDKKYSTLAARLSDIIRTMLYDGTVRKITERTLKDIFQERGNAE